MTPQPLHKLEILPGQNVLDLGSGDGVLSQKAKLFSPGMVIALDLNMSALQDLVTSKESQVASDEIKTLSCVCADALKLPFPDETFDRVICSLVLYFLPFETALEELSRLLKRGGKVYLRLPLLTHERFIYILRRIFSDPQKSLYIALLFINGLYYHLFGRQFKNPLLRHEHMAIFVPRNRFDEAIRQAGLFLESYEIDKPEPGTAAIDAWIRKL